MKILTRTLILLTTLAAAANLAAAPVKSIQGKNQASFGVDATLMYAKPYGDFAKLINNTKLGTSVYMGYRLKGRYGFELGFNWTDRKPRVYMPYVGDQLFGATAAVSQRYELKIRYKETYFDFHAHLPVNKYVEIKLGAGVGFVRQRIKYNGAGINDPIQTILANMLGRTNITGRFLIGVQAMASEHIGLRCMLKYQTLSNVKAHNMPAGINKRASNNSVSAILGIFWTFAPLNDKTDPSYKGDAVMGAPRG